MFLRSDDDIYVVDQRWYGPPGRELPWHARYAAYGWGFILYLLAMIVERVVLRIPLSFQLVAFTLLGVCLTTTYIMRRVDPDRPVWTVLRGYWHELRAPRPTDPAPGKRAKPIRSQLVLSRPVLTELPIRGEANS